MIKKRRKGRGYNKSNFLFNFPFFQFLRPLGAPLSKPEESMWPRLLDSRPTGYLGSLVRPSELAHDPLAPRPGLGGPFLALLHLRRRRGRLLLALLFAPVVVLE